MRDHDGHAASKQFHTDLVYGSACGRYVRHWALCKTTLCSNRYFFWEDSHDRRCSSSCFYPVPIAVFGILIHSVMEGLLRFGPPQETIQQPRFSPSFDVKETKGRLFCSKADLPGSSFRIWKSPILATGSPSVGKREAEERKEGDNYLHGRAQLWFFQRTFTLPESADVDQVKADLNAGVLSIVIPKRTAAQPEKVNVSVGQ